jgi:iron complex outermembrane recepter protein
MKCKTPLALTLALINASVAFSVLAQEETKTTKPASTANAANAESTYALDEIIVTATKRETNLMKTPIAITVVGQETLEREGIANVKDIAKLVPNMDIKMDTSQSAPVIALRGVRSTNITELGDPAVSLHIDGVYSPRPQGAMALMFDVERVEAQRGPQGTLFGRNSTVGNINIITKRPELDDLKGNLGIELANFNHRQVRGMVNIPVSDTFALRGSFMAEKRDSYLDGNYDPNQWDIRYLPASIKYAPHYEGTDADASLRQRDRWGTEFKKRDAQELVKADPSTFYNNADQYSFRLAALWEPTDELSWLTTYEKFQDSSAGGTDTLNCDQANKITVKVPGGYDDGKGGVSATPVEGLRGCEYEYGKGANEYTVNVSVPGYLDMSIDSIRANIRWDFSENIAFIYNGGYAKQVRSQLTDIDRGITGWDMSMFFDGTTYKSQSHEFQLQSTGDGPLQWVTGIYLADENNNVKGGFINSGPRAEFWDQPKRTSKTEAIFGQGTYDLSDDLHLTLGYRYTENEKRDVGGHNKVCDASKPNLVDPTANGGKCFPEWDRDAFNQLPGDYFWNSDIYRNNTNNDDRYSEPAHNYRLGLDYDISDRTMAFVYLANGTKTGGIGDVVVQYEQDPLTAIYPTDANGNRIVKKVWSGQFKEENVLTLETGIKADLLDKTLRLAASVFISKYTDLQTSIAAPLFVQYGPDKNPDAPPNSVIGTTYNVFQTKNIGEAHIQGLELEFDWAASANDRVKGYLTFLHTEIVSDFNQKWGHDAQDLFGATQDEDGDVNNKKLIVNLKGNELAASPNMTFNIDYSHVFFLSGGSTIMPWAGVNWKASSYFTNFNVDKHYDLYKTETPDAWSDTKPSTLNSNVGIKYTAPNDVWSMEAFVNNVTNEIEFYWAGTGDHVIRGPVSMPRFYGIRANYKF